mgnify:CR=1 FL=1
MKKPSLIKRFFSFLLRLCVVLVLMAAIAVGSFEGVTYYLTGKKRQIKAEQKIALKLQQLIIRTWRIRLYLSMMI